MSTQPTTVQLVDAVRAARANRVPRSPITRAELDAWGRLFGALGRVPIRQVAEMVGCNPSAVWEIRRRCNAVAAARGGDDKRRPTLAVVVRSTVEGALERHGGRISDAAIELGMSRYALGRLVRRAAVDLNRPPSCRDLVFDLLSDGEVWTIAAIFEAIHTGDVYVAIQRLVREGAVVRCGRGKVRMVKKG